MKLKLVTFNIRIQSAKDFSVRLPGIVEKIKNSDADVICFQELSCDMKSVLAPLLPDYIIVGGGRNSDRLGEGVPIAYKKDRFVVSELRTRWLSDTPYVPSSRFNGDQSGCPRVYVYACLTEVNEGITFRVYNTHFDHVGKDARFKEAQMILNAVREDFDNYPYPSILTGDLNATSDTPEIRMIVESGLFIDVTDHFEQTFNNFGGHVEEFETKIDYIFISEEILCTQTELWDDTFNGNYLSDHFAIAADLEL